MVRFDIWRAERSGNWPGRNLATKSTERWASNLAGRNACKARAGLERCNVDADPALKRGRPSRSGRTRRESALKPITIGTDRATGVVSTAQRAPACQEGGCPLGAASVGEARGGRRGRVLRTWSEGITDHLGVGEGQRYRGSRVMPVEGRALASGVLAKEERSGDWR